MGAFGKWFLQVLLWPALLEWIRDAVKQGKISADYAAKAKLALDQYDNAKTRDERRAARRTLMDL